MGHRYPKLPYLYSYHNEIRQRQSEHAHCVRHVTLGFIVFDNHIEQVPG